MIATSRRRREKLDESAARGTFIGALTADFPAGGGIPRFAGELLRADGYAVETVVGGVVAYRQEGP